MLTNTFMLHSWNALVVIVINLGNRRRCRICLPEFGSALLCTYLKSTVWWKQKLKSCSSLLSSPLVLWSNSSRSSWFYLFILVFILGIVDVVLVCCQKLTQLLQMLVAEMRTEKKRADNSYRHGQNFTNNSQLLAFLRKTCPDQSYLVQIILCNNWQWRQEFHSLPVEFWKTDFSWKQVKIL